MSLKWARYADWARCSPRICRGTSDRTLHAASLCEPNGRTCSPTRGRASIEASRLLVILGKSESHRAKGMNVEQNWRVDSPVLGSMQRWERCEIVASRARRYQDQTQMTLCDSSISACVLPTVEQRS